MFHATQLSIRLTPGAPRPQWGRDYVNEIRGGPETLLGWLETQLGLATAAIHPADRITEYAAALDTVTDSVIAESMKTDRWATASELLSRRDELLLAAWDEADALALPDVVRALARAATGRVFTFPGPAARLLRVIDALGSGQVLPAHRCHLHDSPELWPALWRAVLARINVVEPPACGCCGPLGSALHAAQTFVRGGVASAIAPDPTFRYVRTRSDSAAVEFVTAALAAAPEKLSTTVVCCEDDDLAVRLDACLSRVGLPTTGSSTWSRAHPVLQILPLSLALCWEPVDPQALLDFLTLPILPLPRKAASQLAKALAKEPGLGSRRWDAVTEELCSEEHDPEGQLRARLDAWLLGARVARGGEIASRFVRTRCGLVAQWAAGRAALLAQDASPEPALIAALQIAARQASMLGELAESQGRTLTEPQLARLLEEALARGVQAAPCMEAAGGPIRVRSLTEIDGPCDRLIWLGLGTADASACRWSVSQLRELRAAGLDLDDGSRALAARRSAETRGCAHIREAFLAVCLPQDLEKRWHPVWLAMRGLLPRDDAEQPPVVEDVVAAGDVASLAPFRFETCEAAVEPPQAVRAVWNIPRALLRDRETVSATELQDRLGCPLKWTLNYQARLWPSPIAQLPGDFQLKGTFCHSILERVLGEGGELPSVDDAVARVAEAFDERLPLDAAPLAQPSRYMERQQLRAELKNATRLLIRTLASGGYRIVGIEVELSGHALGKRLNGWVDCIAAGPGGTEAIIDFKYGGRAKYYSLIEQGRAVQLATYAYGRSTRRGTFPAVAYLVLSDGLFYTPSGSAVQGNGKHSHIQAPAIQTVWERFSAAIEGAEGWLVTDAPVPVRPLQEPDEWPPGANIVLDEKLKADGVQEVCKYCHYGRICGIKETS